MPIFVIFGATGDLTKRKLIPAVYHLMKRREMSEKTAVLCLGRSAMSRDRFLSHLELEQFVKDGNTEDVRLFAGNIFYNSFDIGSGSPEELYSIVSNIWCGNGYSRDILFYLALPTTLFGRVAQLIKPLLAEDGWKRVVFEKPFGQNLKSAEILNDDINAVLEEDQIFRVDHYLGKELVQNILFLRFANQIFSCAWNKDAIDNIQISVCESLGVEDRAGYYDKAGAVRDMLQNHLLQLLTLTAMEPPISGDANAVRDEAARVLAQLRFPATEDIVLGQYGKGEHGAKELPAYLDEKGIGDDSKTETYVALRAYIDTPRWRGVPFYLRTGKRLDSRYAEINIIFKQQPFKGLAGQERPNMISIRIQPDEGIALAINVRKPGDVNSTESVLMDFCHHCHFGPNTPEAYETIMASVVKGDSLLFTRWDWLQASWRYIDNLRAVAPPIVTYPAGSVGPGEADRLLQEDGREWINKNGLDKKRQALENIVEEKSR